ncbi:heterokaryon incompatibility protein-domain-containing protein, partial [Lasiosphaeris hirsuta]
MHGPWHPILHNSPRPKKEGGWGDSRPLYAPIIPNDYSWYRPLDVLKKEIRIMFLEPEPLGSPKPVVAHVFNASLFADNIPRLYGCLSYCWGNPEVTKPVEINYTEKSKETPNGLVTYRTNFNVTTNLEAALRVLRATLSRPVLWADAICIDQSDLGEKASQVPLMAEIYNQAVQTIIWLGEAD